MQRIFSTHSLFESLIDEYPEQAYEHRDMATEKETVANLKEEIRQNLENILNTRLAYIYLEGTPSVLSYGLPDFTQQYYSLQQNQESLCDQIKAILSHFEPRLSQLTVSILEPMSELNRSFQIRIAGEIHLKHQTWEALFESTFDRIRAGFSVV